MDNVGNIYMNDKNVHCQESSSSSTLKNYMHNCYDLEAQSSTAKMDRGIEIQSDFREVQIDEDEETVRVTLPSKATSEEYFQNYYGAAYNYGDMRMVSGAMSKRQPKTYYHQQQHAAEATCNYCGRHSNPSNSSSTQAFQDVQQQDVHSMQAQDAVYSCRQYQSFNPHPCKTQLQYSVSSNFSQCQELPPHRAGGADDHHFEHDHKYNKNDRYANSPGSWPRDYQPHAVAFRKKESNYEEHLDKERAERGKRVRESSAPEEESEESHEKSHNRRLPRSVEDGAGFKMPEFMDAMPQYREGSTDANKDEHQHPMKELGTEHGMPKQGVPMGQPILHSFPPELSHGMPTYSISGPAAAPPSPAHPHYSFQPVSYPFARPIYQPSPFSYNPPALNLPRSYYPMPMPPTSADLPAIPSSCCAPSPECCACTGNCPNMERFLEMIGPSQYCPSGRSNPCTTATNRPGQFQVCSDDRFQTQTVYSADYRPNAPGNHFQHFPKCESCGACTGSSGSVNCMACLAGGNCMTCCTDMGPMGPSSPSAAAPFESGGYSMPPQPYETSLPVTYYSPECPAAYGVSFPANNGNSSYAAYTMPYTGQYAGPYNSPYTEPYNSPHNAAYTASCAMPMNNLSYGQSST